MKTVRNEVTVSSDSGEITFIAATNNENLNGYKYDVNTLQAQDEAGDYHTLTSEAQAVAIPLMVDHSSSVSDKIGTIDQAQIKDGQVLMHATFFNTEQAQDIRQRILDNELTDVSISTTWGDGDDEIQNAKIIEVSVVYAGAEPKAKILAKSAIETPEPVDEPEKTEAETTAAEDDEIKVEIKEDKTMPVQETKTDSKVISKEMVLNSLVKLSKSGVIRKMSRSQVIDAIKNDISLKDGSNDYVVPDAVFTEILSATRPTDILSTFKTLPVKRYTLVAEQRSEADAARAGKYTKDEQKTIQAASLKAQKFNTEFLYKLQKLSYEDLQEDFGDLLYAWVKQELPEKVSEEEERAFIVGDGRQSSDDRHITAVVSLDDAAGDTGNTTVYDYNGTSDDSALAAVLNGTAKLGEDGTTYAVLNKATLARFRAAGLETAAGLPFSTETIAGAFGVEQIFVREYVANNVVYVYTGEYVYRLTGGSNGESIESYDIDYNNQKVEFIRPVGGAASGLYSAVKIELPEPVSA